ncbi:hypothetical protein [Thalassospira sp. MIT1370]|uniref:hypothetical protein n=1 Tax=unclassified Thalassospira TaxID=2648997 RepID=UPI00399A63DF
MISGKSSRICGDVTSGEELLPPALSMVNPCARASPTTPGHSKKVPDIPAQTMQPINTMAAFIRNNRILHFADAAPRQYLTKYLIGLATAYPEIIRASQDVKRPGFPEISSRHFAGVRPRIKPDWEPNRKLSSNGPSYSNFRSDHQNPWIGSFYGRPMGSHGTELGFYGQKMDKTVIQCVFEGIQAFRMYRRIRRNTPNRHI